MEYFGFLPVFDEVDGDGDDEDGQREVKRVSVSHFAVWPRVAMEEICIISRWLSWRIDEDVPE